MDRSITYVALDTHKKERTVALAYADTGEMEVFKVANTAREIKKTVKRIQRKAPGPVRFFTGKARVSPLWSARRCRRRW